MKDPAHPTVMIRPARPEDRGAIEQLLADAGLPLAGVAEHLAEFSVARAAEGIVATAAIESWPPYGLLRSVAVAPSQRGRGLGGLLTARAIEAARARGLRALYLLTTTAERFFPRFGFRVVPRDELPDELGGSEELRGACPETAVVMALELKPRG